jgi:hypothetical protein
MISTFSRQDNCKNVDLLTTRKRYAVIESLDLTRNIRNGIMPHLWGINLSHIYACEVR